LSVKSQDGEDVMQRGVQLQNSGDGSMEGEFSSLRAPREVIRALVLDRNRMSSQLLADSLTRDSRFQSLVATPADAAAVVARRSPHVVIISADLDSGRGEGTRLAHTLSQQFPKMGILILLDRVQRESIVEAFRCGARGVFCRTESVDEFLRCVEHISRGEIWAGKAESDCLLEAFRSVPSPRLSEGDGVQGLTRRELQVVQYAAQGFTNRAIADELRLSEHTVKNYLFRAFEKLGVSSRIELLFYLMVKGRKAGTNAAETPRTEDTVTAFTKAAMDGFTGAQFFLGLAYREGCGVTQNLEDAFFWLKMAAHSAGEILAQASALAEELKGDLDTERIAQVDAKVEDAIGAATGIAHRPPEAFLKEDVRWVGKIPA
jgi:two-component system, NarL family, nitrate/nitrite response regulator NarL